MLLDTVPDMALAERIGERMTQAGAEIADLHLWQVGPGHYAAIVSVVAEAPQAPARYKAALAGSPMLSAVTVEVNGGAADRGQPQSPMTPRLRSRINASTAAPTQVSVTKTAPKSDSTQGRPSH